MVFNSLKENWVEDTDTLATRLGLNRDVVLSSLASYTQAGRAIYDLNLNQYRVRELSQEPLDMGTLRFSSPQEEAAYKMIERNKVKMSSQAVPDGVQLKGFAVTRSGTYHPQMVIDSDNRMTNTSCDCSFFRENQQFKGPCEHLLAIRIAYKEN